MTEIEISGTSIDLSLILTQREVTDSDKSNLKKHIEVFLNVMSEFLLNSGLSLKERGVNHLEISLTICGESKIRSLNNEHRNIDKVTDVLSFPVHETLRAEELDGRALEAMLHLGDLFVCREVAIKQAQEFEITYEQEVVHQIVHGLLHLCGYDHERGGKEEKLMFSLEEDLVEKIYNKLKKL